MGRNVKQVSGKIIFKHQTAAEWDLSNKGAGAQYIPDVGERILYDPDETHPYTREKFGDGEHIVKDLPFALAPLVEGKVLEEYLPNSVARKSYVDETKNEAIAASVPRITSKSDFSYRVYGVGQSGKTQTSYIATSDYSVNGATDAIAKRDENGRCKFNDPVSEIDAANKRYVDKAIANKIGVEEQSFTDEQKMCARGNIGAWGDEKLVQTTGSSENAVMSQKAVSNTFANVLKGSASGEVVRIDDVSPAEHKMAVRVGGKNLFNNNTDNIARVEYIGSTGSVGARFGYALQLPVGTYTCHATYKEETDAKDVYIYGVLNTADGACKQGVSPIQSETLREIVFTVDEGDVLYIYDGIGSHTLTDAQSVFSRVEVQIELGLSATTIVSHIDPSTGKVYQYGKNLIPYSCYADSKQSDNVYFIKQNDGSLNVRRVDENKPTGDMVNFSFASSYKLHCKKGTTLMLSGCPAGGSDKTYRLRLQFVSYEDKPSYDDHGKGKLVTVPESDPTVNVFFTVMAGTQPDRLLVKPQLELGTASTKWEKGITPIEHTPNADGTVDNITSIYPTTTLMTDVADVVLDVDYNRDTDKVINELLIKNTALEASALKGNQSGKLVTILDSYAQSPMEVKVSGAAERVIRCGKNLFDPQLLLDNGYTKLNDGTYQGTSKGVKVIFTNTGRYSGTFTLSYTAKNIEVRDRIALGFLVKYTDGTEKYIASLNKSTTDYVDVVSKTDSSKIVSKIHMVYDERGEINIKRIQLEYGAQATNYEEFAGMVPYLVNADGTVDGVTALTPTTILMTNSSSATINATYIRDANKVMGEITSRIAALESAIQ